VGLIPRVVSIPIKWACKKIINKLLLSFPGGVSDTPLACTYCPEMCRFSCPVANATGNDVLTPSNKMALLYKTKKWPKDRNQELWPIYACTGCGRCTEYCKYRVRVADHLFFARHEYRWTQSNATLSQLNGDVDEDLFFELGSCKEKKKEVLKVDEPKHLYFLKQNRDEVKQLCWEELLQRPVSDSCFDSLKGKTWLIHESVWFSRRLENSAAVKNWVDEAKSKGIELVYPFEHGQDCVDCGGEGAFNLLFERDANTMARKIWERDCHRVNGILCFSKRCARHFNKSLEGKVPIVWIGDLR